MEAAALHFPWRQLGELLVAEELLTEEELEQALAEQASSGRLLGQNGFAASRHSPSTPSAERRALSRKLSTADGHAGPFTPQLV